MCQRQNDCEKAADHAGIDQFFQSSCQQLFPGLSFFSLFLDGIVFKNQNTVRIDQGIEGNGKDRCHNNSRGAEHGRCKRKAHESQIGKNDHFPIDAALSAGRPYQLRNNQREKNQHGIHEQGRRQCLLQLRQLQCVFIRNTAGNHHGRICDI